jgi:hypothetical protein
MVIQDTLPVRRVFSEKPGGDLQTLGRITAERPAHHEVVDPGAAQIGHMFGYFIIDREAGQGRALPRIINLYLGGCLMTGLFCGFPQTAADFSRPRMG